jgi:hypothetical protein
MGKPGSETSGGNPTGLPRQEPAGNRTATFIIFSLLFPHSLIAKSKRHSTTYRGRTVREHIV